MTKVGYRVVVSGRVQGVWFRANTQRQALALGLTGWVCNLPDGRVEAIFEGEEEACAAMLAWCRTGTPPARVDELRQETITPSGTFTGFQIRC